MGKSTRYAIEHDDGGKPGGDKKKSQSEAHIKAGRETRQPAKRGEAGPPGDDWDKLSQREKFIRTARELGCDETGEAVDEALRAIGKARRC